MKWDNQNLGLCWATRIFPGLLLAFALYMAISLSLQVRDWLFSSLIALGLVPWMSVTSWMLWRTRVVRTVALDPVGSSLLLEVGKHLVRVQTPSVNIARGLLWIHDASSPAAALLRPAYPVALYDQNLREFLDACVGRGVRVTRAFGGAGPADVNTPG